MDDSASENIQPVSLAVKPNEELSSVHQLQNACTIKDKRIYELEEIISRQTRQLTQLSEGLLDMRSQMDPEMGQRQMHRIDMLENRLSASLQHEQSLEQQLAEFELKMNDCYEVQCGVRALTEHYQQLRECNKSLREKYRVSVHRLSLACELLAAYDTNQLLQGARKIPVVDGECYSADDWQAEARSECLFGSCSSEPVTHERKCLDKGTQISQDDTDVSDINIKKLDPEDLEQSSIVVARILDNKSRHQNIIENKPGVRHTSLNDLVCVPELSAPACMLDVQTLHLLLERERRLRLNDQLHGRQKSVSSGKVSQSISLGKCKIGTSVVYDFTNNARWM